MISDFTKKYGLSKMFFLLNILLLCFSTNGLASQSIDIGTVENLENLKAKLAGINQTYGVTAMAVSVIENNQQVLLHTQGFANKEQNLKATNNTLFRIGSISKMFVALATLKLVEEGKLDLDDKVKDLAPEFKFNNPWENTHPIQVAHLLEHTTGWADMTLKELSHRAEPDISVQEALSLYPESRTSRWPPGSRMSYSNIGPAVAAYIIEKISGVTFEKYIEDNFFSQLGMDKATFFEPKPSLTATTYLNEQPLDFWHVIYRPSGSISASITEMTQLLKLFIHRGKHNQRAILQEQSIDRMEISTTTPGYEQGVQSGYGLGNYTSGFSDKSFRFHGHSGGLPGGYANLAYNPTQKSGFVLLMTGSNQAFIPAILAIKEYLTRNSASIDNNHSPDNTMSRPVSDNTLDQITGFYKSISPRNEYLKISEDLLGLVKFTSIDNRLQVSTVLGSPLPPVLYSQLEDNLWLDHSSGLPTISFITDPTHGKIAQVGSQFLKPISSIEAWWKIGFLISFLIVLLCSIIYGLFWVPLNLYRKTIKTPDALVRFWPFISGVCFLTYIITLQLGFMLPTQLGVINTTSIAIFILSILYPGLTLWSIKSLVDNRNQTKSYIFWLSAIVSTAHLFLILHLAYYGMIGFRTWA